MSQAVVAMTPEATVMPRPESALRRFVRTPSVAIAAGIIAILALLTAGCGSGSDLGSAATTQTGTPGAGAGDTVHVVMKTLEFVPTSVYAKVGQRVAWLNEDSSPHNVTYVSGPRFQSSGTLGAEGGRFSVRVTQPGTIRYYCTIDLWMKAAIVVSS